MNQAHLERMLAIADQHIADGRRNIAQQHALVEQMEGLGIDVSTANAILASFERALELHVADRDRLLRVLTTA